MKSEISVKGIGTCIIEFIPVTDDEDEQINQYSKIINLIKIQMQEMAKDGMR